MGVQNLITIEKTPSASGALISRSLQAQKAAGMCDSALVVDSDSSSGAIGLYESCGFQLVKQDTVSRKSLSLENVTVKIFTTMGTRVPAA